MARRHGSDIRSRGSFIKRCEVEGFRRNHVRKRKSSDSIFSYVTNISDTGTYEIEICERQSAGTTSKTGLSSKSTTCSKSSLTSKSHTCSKSVCSTSSKSEQNVADVDCCEKRKNKLAQSYYPCFCAAPLEMKDKLKLGNSIVLVEKSVATADGIPSNPTESKGDTTSSATDIKNSRNPSSTDSESRCNCSECTSSSSSESDNSTDDTSRKSGCLSNRTDSLTSSKSCRCAKCRNSPRESTATYTVPSSPKELKDVPAEKLLDTDALKSKTTTVALELITEEKDKQWMECTSRFRTCKCVMDKYEERLKNLENIHFSDKTVAFCSESRNQTCECSITFSQFTEITERITVLEKLLRDSLNKKEHEADQKKETNTVTEQSFEGSYTSSADEMKSKGDTISVSEGVDDTTRMSMELAKIKKRLMDLEEKITTKQLYSTYSNLSLKKNPSNGKDKKLAVNITTTYVTPPAKVFSDKEIQVMNSEDEDHKRKTDKDLGFISENTRLTTYWMMKNRDKLQQWDEAVQTPSRKDIDDCTGDCDVQPEPKKKKRRKFRLKKSCDRIHLCKECDNYIAQKLGSNRGTSIEKLWENRKMGEKQQGKGEKIRRESVHELKRSFNLYTMKNSDSAESDEPKKLSIIRETKKMLDKRRKSDGKKVRLCSKCSKTNLKESKIDAGTDSGFPFAWGAFGRNCSRKTESAKFLKEKLQKGDRGSRKSLLSDKIRRPCFQIYHSREVDVLGSYQGKEFKLEPWTTLGNEMILYDYPRSRFPSGEYGTHFADNPFQYLTIGRDIKIPVLFEEVCASSQKNALHHRMSASMKVVQVGVHENELNPFKKLVRKLSHPQCKEKFIPFGVSRCCCGNKMKGSRHRSGRKNHMRTCK